MAEPVQFYLRCDPDARFFYSVEFHATRAAFLERMAEIEGRPLRKAELDTRAACLRFVYRPEDPEKRALQKKHDLIGTLLFVRGDAPAGVVVHELTHAAVGWARRAKVNPLKRLNNYARCHEERFARTLQFLLEQFYEQAPQALAQAA